MRERLRVERTEWDHEVCEVVNVAEHISVCVC